MATVTHDTILRLKILYPENALK